MSYENKKKKEKVTLPWFGFKALMPFIKPYKKLLVWMVSLGLLSSLLDAAYPLYNRYAVNHFIGGNTLDTLVPFIILYVLTMLIHVVDNFKNVNDCGKMEMYLDRDLSNAAFEHVQTLSFSYFNQNSVGYIHARIISDTEKIGGLVAWRMMDLVWYGSYILFVLAVMLVTNFRLALYVIILVPLACLLISFFQAKLVKYNREVRELNSVITGDINEGITGAKEIKTLVVEKMLAKEFAQDTEKMYQKSVHTARYSALFESTVTLMSSVTLAVILWKGGKLSLNGLMELGTLSVFMSYAIGMLEPIQNIIKTLSALASVQVNIERFDRLLHTQTEVVDSDEVIRIYGDTFEEKRENWEELKGKIDFEDVTFHYPDGEELVLEHFNLHVPQGTNVAIVGETGAGKSTLVNLVCRFFEPTEGRILIDDKDVRERSQQWLHSNIGYVLQTPHLFSGTVRDNLRYGNPDASDEEILEAIHLVCADFVLEKMEEGLDTYLGEGGDSLSTGEKQLLSFARALLADPKILILDEATSSIDTMTEKAIQDAIQTVIRGRTSFMIAHRLSTVINADVILVVEDGMIKEQGNHFELMHKKGIYYELYTRQFEEIVVDMVV